MKATFVELPPFERIRKDCMDDEAYRLLQLELLDNPKAGDVIEGTGGLRKLRRADPRCGKGKRGSLRVIYLSPAQRKVLKKLLKSELKNRQSVDGEPDDQDTRYFCRTDRRI